MIGLLIAAHMYTVKTGDTLWGLVGNRWPMVCEQNHIQDCNLIYPGQELNINVSGITLSYRSDSGDSDNAVSPSISGNSASFAGTLSCSGLENLWTAAGGNPGSAFIAAEIAMAESGGQQYATGPAGEEGYWQINPINGDATYNAIGNAQAAIHISGNGTDWSAWTTYTQGLYQGRC